MSMIEWIYKTEDVDGIKKRQYVGCYVNTKPNWFHRLMARLLLGWKWEDRK